MTDMRELKESMNGYTFYKSENYNIKFSAKVLNVVKNTKGHSVIFKHSIVGDPVFTGLKNFLKRYPYRGDIK